MRAFRGATTVEADDPTMIRVAVRDLMNEMLDVNELVDDDLVDVILTVTPDLTSMYAGKALREECGFSDVPLLGAVEADVAAGIDRQGAIGDIDLRVARRRPDRRATRIGKRRQHNRRAEIYLNF